ncbi:hypothetical protein ANN_08083 [Periplaneta americana]|uniref:Uncharacterized protein n=1 Tax=Periplaneta americana TaxID=6978 RepID=A0ABQ8T211_PERAM|nr:hypothetical protein ANN_08083 [Periplaneta americana]
MDVFAFSHDPTSGAQSNNRTDRKFGYVVEESRKGISQPSTRGEENSVRASDKRTQRTRFQYSRARLVSVSEVTVEDNAYRKSNMLNIKFEKSRGAEESSARFELLLRQEGELEQSQELCLPNASRVGELTSFYKSGMGASTIVTRALYFVEFHENTMRWPARSPDLTSLDFYLWGHLRAVVYATPVNDAEELLQRVENVYQLIRDDKMVFERTRQSCNRRAQA